MAASLIGGAAVGAVFGELLNGVLELKDKAVMFKSTLVYLRSTLIAIAPVIKEIEIHNNNLGRPKEELESLIREMEEGTKLVSKCSKIHRLNYVAKVRYQQQLEALVDSLVRFFMLDMQAQMARDQKETLLKVTRILSTVNKFPFGTKSEDKSEPIDENSEVELFEECSSTSLSLRSYCLQVDVNDDESDTPAENNATGLGKAVEVLVTSQFVFPLFVFTKPKRTSPLPFTKPKRTSPLPFTFGRSRMINLNLGIGFTAGVTTRGNKILILAFEVANTIVKGANLMQSLSKENIRHLKEVVLPSEGVQNLISRDMDELLRNAAADKREELKIFCSEVVRFGNSCIGVQWHNLDRYFEWLVSELILQKQLLIKKTKKPQKQLKEEAEMAMQQLITFVQYTAELYHELHALDRIHMLLEEDNSNATQRGDSLAILRAELKSRSRHARNLKKKSLWSKSLEEVMEKLVDIVCFLNLEIHEAFGSADTDKEVKDSQGNHKKLGSAGLALHYANIITQIDTLVPGSSSVPPNNNTRDALYQGLPPNVKSALRSRLQSFQVKKEVHIPNQSYTLLAGMEKTLQWLVPIANNTIKFEMNRNPADQTNLLRIETLHHADKEKTDAYILELIIWLHHLVSHVRVSNGEIRSPVRNDALFSTRRLPSIPIIDFDIHRVVKALDVIDFGVQESCLKATMV